MDSDILPLTSKLRGDPEFDMLYQKSWFLLNRGILELLKVVATLRNSRVPAEIASLRSEFNPTLWLSNWLRLNNPHALPYNATFSAMMNLSSSTSSVNLSRQSTSSSGSTTTVSSQSVALECISRRPQSIDIDSTILLNEKKKAHDIAVASIYLFIEARRVERVQALDELRAIQDSRKKEEQDRLLQVRNARLKAKADALNVVKSNVSLSNKRRKSIPMNISSSTNGKLYSNNSSSMIGGKYGSTSGSSGSNGSTNMKKDYNSIHHNNYMNTFEGLGDANQPVDITLDIPEELYLYVETPEEVLAQDYIGMVNTDILVECLYEHPEILQMLRLPTRKPGSRPPFASLFRAIAPNTTTKYLGPGPGVLCECLWALAFRSSTPLCLPIIYGCLGKHTPIRSYKEYIPKDTIIHVDSSDSIWGDAVQTEIITTEAKKLLNTRITNAAKELAASRDCNTSTTNPNTTNSGSYNTTDYGTNTVGKVSS